MNEEELNQEILKRDIISACMGVALKALCQKTGISLRDAILNGMHQMSSEGALRADPDLNLIDGRVSRG